MVLSMVNNKGGVAKTTTAINLAAGLANAGHRVLLIDLDSQGSASFSLGVERGALHPSMADVLLNDTPIQDAIRTTQIQDLDLVTGSMELANADLVLADVRGREHQIAEAIEPARDLYAYVLIDCPPSLSLLPLNALVASDTYIVPVTAHYLALEGLVNLMGAVDRIREGIGMQAELLGLLLTVVDYRARATREIVDIIRGHYGDQVLETEIRINVRLSEAPSFGRTIFQHDPSSTGAEAYRALTAEVLRRCGKMEIHKDGKK